MFVIACTGINLAYAQEEEQQQDREKEKKEGWYIGGRAIGELIKGELHIRIVPMRGVPVLKWLLTYAPLIQLVVLIATAIFVMRQMYQQGEQLRANQLIAWKRSLHDLNQMAIGAPDIFKQVLYKNAKDKKEVERLTAAYASLHALEAIYYMRKDEEFPPERLEAFLRQYVSSDEMRSAWKVEAAHAAFTREFQDKLDEIIGVEKVPPVQERITTLEQRLDRLKPPSQGEQNPTPLDGEQESPPYQGP